MLFTLLCSTFLELLRLFICLLNGLTDFALLLASLYNDSDVACTSVLRTLTDDTLSIFPICDAGADFVAVMWC